MHGPTGLHDMQMQPTCNFSIMLIQCCSLQTANFEYLTSKSCHCCTQWCIGMGGKGALGNASQTRSQKVSNRVLKAAYKVSYGSQIWRLHQNKCFIIIKKCW